MDDIFDEIEGDLRAERHRALLRRYGGIGLAALLVLVGGVAGWQGWKAYQARQNQSVAQTYLTAMQDADGVATSLAPAQNPATAHALDGFLKVASDAPGGYRTLARLRAAALKADGGDLAGAVGLWTDVAQDGAADQLLRDMASLLIVEHQIDSADPAKLRAALAPIAVATNSWHALAQEAQALLDLRQGMTDDARQVLRGLAQDVTAPSGLRGRANGLLARLGA